VLKVSREEEGGVGNDGNGALRIAGEPTGEREAAADENMEVGVMEDEDGE
jgi:hypothetical protein